MFTGLIEDIGEISLIEEREKSQLLSVRSQLFRQPGAVAVGDSIAVSGVCLTGVNIKDDTVSFEISEETLRRSTFSSSAVGSRMNIERALPADGRFGGHIVQGHVDGVGEIIEVKAADEHCEMTVAFPETLSPFIAEKGSIALDGISLTVGEVKDRAFKVYLVPHTLENTNLSGKDSGDTVNIEVDCIARYVASAVGAGK